MKFRYIFSFVLCLILLVGCSFGHKEESISKELVISFSSFVFLDTKGNVVPFSDNWILYSSRRDYAYDWDAFNADYGPFVSLGGYSAKKADGSWVRLPPSEGIGHYYIGYTQGRPSDELNAVLRQFGCTVWVWLSNSYLDENNRWNGTVKLIAKDLDYPSKYLKEEYDIFPEILYGTFDFSDCETGKEATRKLLEAYNGDMFLYTPPPGSQGEEDMPPTLSRYEGFDFSREENLYLDPSRYPEEKEVDPAPVRELSYRDEKLTLDEDGTLNGMEDLFPVAQTWTDLRDFVIVYPNILIGVRNDGTLCYDMAAESREFKVWFDPQIDLNTLAKMQDVERYLFDWNQIPFFLMRDGTLDCPLSPEDKAAGNPFPQYRYTDSVATEICGGEGGSDPFMCYVLRCSDGRTVVVYPNGGHVRDYYQNGYPSGSPIVKVYD